MALSAFLLGMAGIAGAVRDVPGNQGPIPQMQGQERRVIEANLESVDRPGMPMLARTNMYKLDKSKRSPLQGWEFEWVSTGFGAITNREQMLIRARVFSQVRKAQNDPAQDVVRMIMRMWDMNFSRMGKDHNPNHYLQTVDVYLCYGGRAGGQQLVALDPESPAPNGAPGQVNTIYFYDIGSFTDPLEKAREVAHEYGHATLNAFGIYTAPEEFAGGDVGERLYLSWLLEAMKANKIGTHDVMGATQAQLEGYVQTKVHPLVKEFAKAGPKFEGLDRRDEAGYNALLSAVLYANVILPPTQLRRAMDFIDNNRVQAAEEIYNAAVELPELKVTIPGYLGGEAIWLPAGKGKITGGKALQTVGNWVKVQPQGAVVTITYPNSQ